MISPLTLSPDLAKHYAASLRLEAEYENTAHPLYLKLIGKNWGKVVAWHTARWQKDIPTPADLAQRQFSEAHVMWGQVLHNVREKEFAASFDEHQHIAERLRNAANLLTDPVENSQKRVVSWALKGLLAYEYRLYLPAWQQLPSPSDVGELLAKVEHFFYCWHTFQEAEAGSPAATATPAPVADTPHPAPDAPTVADLCHNGFIPHDLAELLQRLAVIDAAGNCLTNDLRGKGRGKRGAFTAAYRVLHRAGLLAPTVTDKEWAAAFKKEYGANLGADVIAHQLTAHAHAPQSAPGPFQRAVDDAAEWVAEWKSRR